MGRFMSMLGMLFGFGTFGRGFVGTLVGGGAAGGAPPVPPLGRVWAEALDESRKAANINPSECETKWRDMEPPTRSTGWRTSSSYACLGGSYIIRVAGAYLSTAERLVL